ncbi:peptide chain release factor N(5)-glutamine methyltransferase [Chloroflexota bacterium]
MIVRQALARAGEILAASSIENPSLESELLLRHTLGIDRVQLYLDFDYELNPEEYEKFRSLVQRRLSNEPTAYITGHREFYGLDFYVDSSVLIPRPETELLVDKVFELSKERSLSTIADIGTGCGAIAISLAANLPQARIYATDISAAALEVALSNCWKHGMEDRIILLEGDMLDSLPEPVDIIVANLPYVRESELATVNTHDFEPSLALGGGADGLDKIRRLCGQVSEKLSPGGSMLLEIGQGQGEAVTGLLRSLFPSTVIEVEPDLCGIERIVSLSLVQQ